MLDVIHQDPTRSNKPRETRILLVEDNDFIRISTMLMFHELGHYPDDALNGREALELVKSKVYDLIFTDIGLPDMDGMQIAKAIRQHEQENAQTSSHIFAFTAYSVPEIKAECLAAGINEVLPKPMTLERLRALFASIYAEKMGLTL